MKKKTNNKKKSKIYSKSNLNTGSKLNSKTISKTSSKPYFKINWFEEFIIFIKGMCMGAADIVPGISGGTIALVMGIYQRLITGIDTSFKKGIDFFKFLFKGKIKESFNSISEIDFLFFVPLMFGIGLSFLLLSKAIHFLLDFHIAPTYSFFFGLIFASGIFVYRQIDDFNIKNLFFVIVGAVFAYFFIGLNPLNADNSIIVIFLSGILAICAMLLPGISGSFVLVFLGQYKFMLNALNNFLFSYIFAFIAGALLGVIIFSRVVDFLLEKHRKKTLSFIIGLMIGSLRLPYEKVMVSGFPIYYAILFAIAGIIVVFILDLFSRKMSNKN